MRISIKTNVAECLIFVSRESPGSGETVTDISPGSCQENSTLICLLKTPCKCTLFLNSLSLVWTLVPQRKGQSTPWYPISKENENKFNPNLHIQDWPRRFWVTEAADLQWNHRFYYSGSHWGRREYGGIEVDAIINPVKNANCQGAMTWIS